MKNRILLDRVKECSKLKTGRIIVLTGARQTGKTTLANKIPDDYSYISLEDPVLRDTYKNLSADQIYELYPKAIFDEIQKQASLIESIKAVYDKYPDARYLLTGSSQLLLLQKVRESLAGRSNIFELFPLTLPELRTKNWEDKISESLLIKELKKEANKYLPSFLLDNERSKKIKAYENALSTGCYPAVSDNEIDISEKLNWLQNYVKTYLERDIRDLANFRDLEPFTKLQRYLAYNTSSLLNISDLSKRLGISAKTVQRYINYLEISYQALSLPAWSANLNKRLSRMPKIHMLDNGILQVLVGKSGSVTGPEFESFVVSEIYKQIQSYNIQAKLYHLRTYDGKELDLLIEMEDRYYAFKIKLTDKSTKKDIRHLKDIKSILDKPLDKAFLLSNDPATTYYSDNIIALNVAMFLG